MKSVRVLFLLVLCFSLVDVMADERRRHRSGGNKEASQRNHQRKRDLQHRGGGRNHNRDRHVSKDRSRRRDRQVANDRPRNRDRHVSDRNQRRSDELKRRNRHTDYSQNRNRGRHHRDTDYDKSRRNHRGKDKLKRRNDYGRHNNPNRYGDRNGRYHPNPHPKKRYRHVPYRYNDGYRHARRYEYPRYYYQRVPRSYIYKRNWVRWLAGGYSIGYNIIDGYPYYVYRGYRHRYSPYDYCNYELVDDYDDYVVDNFYGVCKRSYDRCADLRDEYNWDEGTNRYFCAENSRY